MKRNTPDHPKLSELAEKLNIPLYAAGGLLEFLWSFSSKYAIQGDIGKWSNKVIARRIGWPIEDADRLILALIETKWIDKVDAPWFLVIHDLRDHAENYWRQNLEDAGLTFWDGSPPRKPKGGYSSKTPEKLQRNSRDMSFFSSKTPQPLPLPLPLPLPFKSLTPLPLLGDVSEIQQPISDEVDSKKKKKKPKTILDPEYQEIWNAHPSSRRGGKEEVEKALRVLEKKTKLNLVLEAVKSYASSLYVKSRLGTPDECFIKQLAPFLNSGKWNEDRAAWQIPRSGNGQFKSDPNDENRKLTSEEKARVIKSMCVSAGYLKQAGKNDSEAAKELKSQYEKIGLTWEELKEAWHQNANRRESATP